MIRRRVCVHGHFYQPPRENPWLDAIEPQPSARPYPDWNERITAECYRPNASARIVDGHGRIIGIVDNYARMSFDVGPTLMSWLEREAPDVHATIVAADRDSVEHFGGHGSAMAQAYNHMIMPLASRRDRETQVRWGVRDFQHRFGRDPDGMWLPECAVDVATLEVLAAQGLGFTVLAPHQARRVRPPGGDWIEVVTADPGRVYRCRLPSGATIDLYFYDGPLAQAVAFENLLVDGGRLAARLADGGATGDQVVLRHIATDGETYGHHHRYGDMALAWALTSIDRGDLEGAALTNYAQFRAEHPATWEVEIRDNTSWSCAHGIERWRDDCGCSSGGHPEWRQAWRRPLRDALDWLRDRVGDVLDTVGASLFRDPWAARDAYIDVLLDRDATGRFLDEHGARPLAGGDRVTALRVMELARNAMLMYTSCGWFFDELTGIETIQVLHYAARVCELCRQVGGGPVEDELVARLAGAASNLPEHGDGRKVWRDRVAPARIDLPHVVAHFATVQVLDDSKAQPSPVYCYQVTPRAVTRRRTGKARLLAAVTTCRSQLTEETAELGFAVLHLGEHQLVGGVQPFPGDAAWSELVEELTEAFLSADPFAAQRTLDRRFGGVTFSLGSLFGRERTRVLGDILDAEVREADAVIRRLYDRHAPLMRYLVGNDLPVPDSFTTAAELVLRRRILAALEEPAPSLDEVRACLGEAGQLHIDLDTPEVAYAAGHALQRMIERLDRVGDDPVPVEQLARLCELATTMRSPLDLWGAQNAAWHVRQRELVVWRGREASGDPVSARLVTAFERLARAIGVST